MDQSFSHSRKALDTERFTLYTQLIQEANLATCEAEVFQIAARYTAQILGADRCSIALLDETGEQFDIIALDGWSDILVYDTCFQRKSAAGLISITSA